MLKSLGEIIKQLLGYANDTKKNSDDIKSLQTKYEAMNFGLQQVAFEVDRDRQIGARDRENLLLRLENVLLKSADPRALPPAPATQNTPQDVEARITILENRVDILNKRVEALENP